MECQDEQANKGKYGDVEDLVGFKGDAGMKDQASEQQNDELEIEHEANEIDTLEHPKEIAA